MGFASSFEKGLTRGQDVYFRAMEQGRAEEAAQRAQQEFAWKEQDRARAASRLAEEDAAFGVVRGLSGGVYDGKQFGLTAQDASAGPVQPQEPAGLSTPRKATDLDYNQALQGVALARRDMQGLSSLRTENRALSWSDKFAKLMGSYTGDDAQVGAALSGINDTSKRITIAEPDKSGNRPITVVGADKRASLLTLSPLEQSKVFAAASLLQEFPQEALQVIAGVNKDLATAVAAENNLTAVVHGMNDKDAARSETRRHNQVVEADSKTRTGIAAQAARNAQDKAQLVELVNDKGEAVLFDARAIKPEADGTYRLPQGLKFPSRAQPKTGPTLADQKTYLELYGNQPSSFPDTKTGLKLPISALNQQQLLQEMTASAGGLPDIASVNRPGVRPQGQTQRAALQPTAVLSSAAQESSPLQFLGLNSGKRYNVQMSDGTTRIMTAEELKQAGLPVNPGVAGSGPFYDPNYR